MRGNLIQFWMLGLSMVVLFVMGWCLGFMMAKCMYLSPSGGGYKAVLYHFLQLNVVHRGAAIEIQRTLHSMNIPVYLLSPMDALQIVDQARPAVAYLVSLVTPWMTSQAMLL